jgi:isopenicillin-N epimerase
MCAEDDAAPGRPPAADGTRPVGYPRAVDDAHTHRRRGSPWRLDPALAHLNHGSFGACPGPVLEAQSLWRERIEADPTGFFRHDLWPALDRARTGLAGFVGAAPEDLVFVANATAGVNAVLRSLDLAPGDELLTTDHAYGSCRRALDLVAARSGCRVVTAAVPFPLARPGDVLDAVLERLSERTRLALVDHVTSPTALVFPIDRLIAALAARGVDTLVDGAHAPGMLDLDVAGLGAAWYVGNCHKWLCAPRGAAFLHARRDRQARLWPLVLGEGRPPAAGPVPDLHRAFDWPGTFDPSPWLAVPDAIRWVGDQLPGGWPAVRARNRSLALHARTRLCAALEAPPPAPEGMIGAMAAVPLPAGLTLDGGEGAEGLRDRLRDEHGIVVPVIPWPNSVSTLLRVSAHLYNRPDDYERLIRALTG